MPHTPSRVVLSAVLFMALVVAASQSFAESFRVANEYSETVVARCSGGTWTDVERRDSLYFDCSGDSLEVAADADGTDSVTIQWSCSGNEFTSPGGGIYQLVQDVIITKSDKGYDGFSIAQPDFEAGGAGNCSLQAVGTSEE